MPTIMKYQSPHTKEPEFFELDEKNTPADGEFVNAIDKCNSMYLTTGKFPQRMYKKEFTSVADEHEQKWFEELKSQPPIHNVRPGKFQPGEPQTAKRMAAMQAQAHMMKVMISVIGAAKQIHEIIKPESLPPDLDCSEAFIKAKSELAVSLNQFEEFMKALDHMGSKSGVAQFSGK